MAQVAVALPAAGAGAGEAGRGGGGRGGGGPGRHRGLGTHGGVLVLAAEELCARRRTVAHLP